MRPEASRVVPILTAHELRRDFAGLFAGADRLPDVAHRLREVLPATCLDLLWTSDEAPEARAFAARLHDLGGRWDGVVLVAGSALDAVVRELPRGDACGTGLRRLRAGEALVSFHHVLASFDDRRLPCLGWIGRRDDLLLLVRRLHGLAAENVPVLLTGETGAGKEVAARALHRLGPRRESTWMAVNCAELPEAILESELFGHARGAFTGATADRPGLFEAAADGTAFLDEIGELPAAAQAKLLRVLEDHRVRRIGTSELRVLHCRVVAATNRDLAAEVAGGRFRADLFYRIRGAELALPPLRERPDDVLAIADAFLARARLRFRRRMIGISEEAKLALLAHRWPGNVRELRQVIEAATLAADTPWLRLEDLSLVRPREAVRDADAVLTVQALERAHILRALATTAGNKMAAARLLGLSRQSLQRRIERHGIALPTGNGRSRPLAADTIGHGPAPAPANPRPPR